MSNVSLIIEGLHSNRVNAKTGHISEGVVDDYSSSLKEYLKEVEDIDTSSLKKDIEEVKAQGAYAYDSNTPGDWKFTYTRDLGNILPNIEAIRKSASSLLDHIEGRKKMSYRSLTSLSSYSLSSLDHAVELRRGVRGKKLSELSNRINKVQDVINKYSKFIYDSSGSHHDIIQGLIKVSKLDLGEFMKDIVIPEFSRRGFNESIIRIKFDHTGSIIEFTDYNIKVNDVKRVVKFIEKDPDIEAMCKSIDVFRVSAGVDKGLIKVRFIQR